jgi:hypothetical protein
MAARKHPESLREAIETGFTKSKQDIEFADFTEDLLKNGAVIERAEDVQKRYLNESGVEMKLPKIRKVMRDHLGLRYLKMINVAVQANSDRCRI